MSLQLIDKETICFAEQDNEYKYLKAALGALHGLCTILDLFKTIQPLK